MIDSPLLMLTIFILCIDRMDCPFLEQGACSLNELHVAQDLENGSDNEHPFGFFLKEIITDFNRLFSDLSFSKILCKNRNIKTDRIHALQISYYPAKVNCSIEKMNYNNGLFCQQLQYAMKTLYANEIDEHMSD